MAGLTAPSYEDLPDWEQEIIEDARIFVGDLDPDNADRYLVDDEWTAVLGMAIRDFNKTQPRTSFDYDSFPEDLSGVIELGLLYHFALARSNRFIERVAPTGYQGPNVDRSVLWQRWNQRAQELRPEWKKARNRSKLLFLPQPAGTIDSYSFAGKYSQPTSRLRGLPSWATGIR